MGTPKKEKTPLHQQNGNGVITKHMETGVKPGHVKWVKLRATSWWPVQVVDEKAIADGARPPKRNSDDVLVRVYGTNDYAYVDLLNSDLEFDKVLKQHKCSHKEMLQKALKQDYSVLYSNRSKTRHSKDVEGKATPKKRGSDKRDEEKKRKPNGQSPDKTPQECGRSARRVKVMQELGLSAPSGSPFLRNGKKASMRHSK